MARTSLEFAFLPGDSLWRDARRFTPVAACANTPPGAPTPSADCQRLLAASDKARLEWALEHQFELFEKKF